MKGCIGPPEGKRTKKQKLTRVKGSAKFTVDEVAARHAKWITAQATPAMQSLTAGRLALPIAAMRLTPHPTHTQPHSQPHRRVLPLTDHRDVRETELLIGISITSNSQSRFLNSLHMGYPPMSPS